MIWDYQITVYFTQKLNCLYWHKKTNICFFQNQTKTLYADDAHENLQGTLSGPCTCITYHTNMYSGKLFSVDTTKVNC